MLCRSLKKIIIQSMRAVSSILTTQNSIFSLVLKSYPLLPHVWHNTKFKNNPLCPAMSRSTQSKKTERKRTCFGDFKKTSSTGRHACSIVKPALQSLMFSLVLKAHWFRGHVQEDKNTFKIFFYRTHASALLKPTSLSAHARSIINPALQRRMHSLDLKTHIL